MNIEEFNRRLTRQCKAIDDFRRRELPILAGRAAKNHFQDNFRQGGFVNGGLHAWQITKRQQSGSRKASAKRGPLLSARHHLFDSIKYIPGNGQVTITNSAPHAALHNNGGEITTHPQVTPKMRKFAWAQYFNEAGITKKMKAGGKRRKALEADPPEEAMKWKRLALTPKTRLDVHATIPKRQFIGDSRELEVKVNELIETNISNILNI